MVCFHELLIGEKFDVPLANASLQLFTFTVLVYACIISMISHCIEIAVFR